MGGEIMRDVEGGGRVWVVVEVGVKEREEGPAARWDARGGVKGWEGDMDQVGAGMGV